MALYTGRDLNNGDVVVDAADGLSIPVIDFRDPIKNEPKSAQRARAAWIEQFQEYWWEQNIAAQMKMEAATSIDFRITFVEFPNHRCILSNMFLKHPTHKAYNDGLLKDRLSDPGVGAFSYHMGREVFVHRDVEEGEELFLNYGYCGQPGHYEPDWGVYVKGYKDYSIAANAAIKIWSELQEYSSESSLKGTERTKQLAILDDIVFNASKQVESINEKASSLLPKTYESLKSIKENAVGQDREKKFTQKLAREIGSTPRTVEWLEENGMCADTIVPSSSTLEHAGQGAIAKRLVSEGEVIVPAPMLHITDREALRMNVNTDDPNAKPYQLLMNYCFGHNQSSILLCPIINAMLINHCSSRRKQECGGERTQCEIPLGIWMGFQQNQSFF